MENMNGQSPAQPPAGSNDEQYEKWLQQALAGLQLPHMPRVPMSQQHKPEAQPSIRILLVSDVDLPSASALAEYTLLQNNRVFDASRIDLCIACGPFCRDEDLLPYLKGKQRRQLQQILEEEKQSNATGTPTWSSSVFFRSQEETAAMEGLVTAAISQLESIVCRVVFCPGSTDPLSTSGSTTPDNTTLRFTPNSRNIHRQWLPLAPGLGCAGLLFLDSPNGVLQVEAPKGRPANHRIQQAYDDSDDEDEEDEDDDYEEGRHYSRSSASLNLAKLHGNREIGADNYCRTLERLLRLASPPQPNYPFGTKLSQTILVTHYFQPPLARNRMQRRDSDDDEDVPRIYGSPVDAHISDNEGDDDNSNAEQHAHHLVTPARAVDEIDNCDKPWPNEHTDFVDSSLAQDQLALEIASGGGAAQRPTEMQKGNVRIVIPGSLRERGEFCLVDMSLVEQAVKKNMTPTPAPVKKLKSTFAWTVRNVDFHTMERLP